MVVFFCRVGLTSQIRSLQDEVMFPYLEPTGVPGRNL